MDLPKRKNIRLTEYDYSTAGAYFITICTKDRSAILSNIAVGASIARPKEIHLTEYGRIAETAIKNIPEHYPAISVDNYVIMPDHIHLLLQIHADCDGRAMPAPTVGRVIQQLKGVISKQIGHSIWQKSYNDHIVRSDDDYRDIGEYIEYNALK